MSEQITVTLTLGQAEAVLDAVTCMTLAAEGDVCMLTAAFMPHPSVVDSSDNRLTYLSGMVALAGEVADMLGPEIISAYRRDPELQDFLHRVKMLRKYGTNDQETNPQ